MRSDRGLRVWGLGLCSRALGLELGIPDRGSKLAEIDAERTSEDPQPEAL